MFVLKYSRKMKYVGSFVPGDRTHAALAKEDWVSTLTRGDFETVSFSLFS